MRKLFPGEFEQMVLLAILQPGERAYAVPIRRMIEQRAGRRAARGRMGEPTAERGGRSERFFIVTALGVRALRNSRDAMVWLWRGFDSVLGKAP